MMLKLAGQACHDLGYKVHIADDAIEAIKELTARRFDLILLDHNIDDVITKLLMRSRLTFSMLRSVYLLAINHKRLAKLCWRQISNFIYKPLSKSAIGMKAMQLIGQ